MASAQVVGRIHQDKGKQLREFIGGSDAAPWQQGHNKDICPPTQKGSGLRCVSEFFVLLWQAFC